jgi:hypothetical protein
LNGDFSSLASEKRKLDYVMGNRVFCFGANPRRAADRNFERAGGMTRTLERIQYHSFHLDRASQQKLRLAMNRSFPNP